MFSTGFGRTPFGTPDYAALFAAAYGVSPEDLAAFLADMFSQPSMEEDIGEDPAFAKFVKAKLGDGADVGAMTGDQLATMKLEFLTATFAGQTGSSGTEPVSGTGGSELSTAPVDGTEEDPSSDASLETDLPETDVVSSVPSLSLLEGGAQGEEGEEPLPIGEEVPVRSLPRIVRG